MKVTYNVWYGADVKPLSLVGDYRANGPVRVEGGAMADSKRAAGKATAKTETAGAGGRWHLVQQGNRFSKIQSEEAPSLEVEKGERMKVLIGSGDRETIDRLANAQAEAFRNAVIEG